MSKSKIAVVVCLWLAIISVAAMSYKWIFRPKKEQEKQAKEVQKKQQMIDGTSASARYDKQIDFAIDSFCGFAPIRSKHFQDEMAKYRIKVNFVDDGADYDKRIKAFKDGRCQMGVFTLDALIKACSDQGGTPPVTVVAFVDETRGADAMVGYKDAFPNIDALNGPDVKIVRPEGPSDTLTRVIMSHFHLNNLSKNAFVPANDARDVFEKYRKAKPTDKQVYVLWEPFVSKMLENPNLHIITDSSKFHGYILDVIVVSRDYLYKNPDVVKQVVAAYLTSLYANRDDMVTMMVEDAKQTDQPLNQKDAKRVIDGLWLKNTQDNYAQMGVVPNPKVQHVEDIISNITKVLISTGAIPSDPTNGKPGLLYFDGVLKKLNEENFFPGVEKARDDSMSLPALTDQQWGKLQSVGRMSVEPLAFARGTATLTGSSEQKLADLVEKLKTWPQYYLLVSGNASKDGDAQANSELARDRAKAAEEWLTAHGIDKNRVRSKVNVTGETSVNFILGLPPF